MIYSCYKFVSQTKLLFCEPFLKAHLAHCFASDFVRNVFKFQSIAQNPQNFSKILQKYFLVGPKHFINRFSYHVQIQYGCQDQLCILLAENSKL